MYGSRYGRDYRPSAPKLHPRDVKCRKCKAGIGERCIPRTVLIGWHLERVLDAGVEVKR